MTIILFLIDTSASMNQRTFMGTSVLDVAKTAVDTFLKMRQKDPSRQFDRYMLLTFEDPPNHLKAGWKENHATFTTQLKSLRATGLSNYGRALGNAFHLLNINRLSSAIDSFGTGRRPFYLEPVMLIAITDGCSLTSVDGIQKELEFRLPDCLGSELCREPFRWDQRLFTIVLRIPASEPENTPLPGSPVPSDPGPSTLMSEVTGGRSYCVHNQQMLSLCLESLTSKVQHGVVVVLEKDDSAPAPPPPVIHPNHSIVKENGLCNGYPESKLVNHDNGEIIEIPPNGLSAASLLSSVNNSLSRSSSPYPSTSVEWHSTRKMIHVQRATKRGFSGFWPIPEDYWPDPQSSTLPPRAAHPILKFSCKDVDPLVLEGIPFDKYELEPSPLTQKILERKTPSVCWQVYVENSGKNGTHAPIGYLKASTNLACVNLFIMAYDYPRLLKLCKELIQVHNYKPTKEWRAAFDKYLKTVPSYYLLQMKETLRRLIGVDLPVFDEHSPLSYSVVSYLKRVKQEAKLEYERLCQVATQYVQQPEAKPLVWRSSTPIEALVKRAARLRPLYSAELSAAGSRKDPPVATTDPATIGHLRLPPKQRPDPAFLLNNRFTNPFDTPRCEVVRQVAKMRANLLHRISSVSLLTDPHAEYLSLQSSEAMHSQLVEKMGSYHEYASLMPAAMRSLEAAPSRLHAFGNPFKLDKKNMHADEIDIDVDLPLTNGSDAKALASPKAGGDSHLLRKRKPGPLPKNFRYKRRRPGQGTAISEAFEIDLSDLESLASDDACSSGGLSIDFLDDDVIEHQQQEGVEERMTSSNVTSASTSFISGEDVFAAYENVDYDEPVVQENSNSPPPSTSPSSRGAAAAASDPGRAPPPNLPSLKREVSALVRKPGWRYEPLLHLVTQHRAHLLSFAVTEAMRFKRHQLIGKLKDLAPAP